MERIKRKREDLGERWRQPEEVGNLVFLTSMGSPIGRYSVESDMRYITSQINDMYRMEALYGSAVQKTFERIHPHALRHTFATLALQNGVDIKTLSGMLGHYSSGFTLDTYTHITDKMQQEAAEKVGSFMEMTF